MLFLFLRKLNNFMFSFLRKLYGKNSNRKLTDGDPMKKFLIVGLGNIGPKYANTRHNIGFKILDFLAKKAALTFESKKLGDVAVYKLKGRSFILLKPSTFMNLSGKAVRYWLEKEKISVANLLESVLPERSFEAFMIHLSASVVPR